MATLTDTAAFARKAIILIIISIISTSLLFLTVPIVISKLKKPEPPPVVKPESGFGKLPPIVFPENKTYPLSFKLENIEGRPPEASTTAKVYYNPKKSPTLFSRKNALSFAQKLGFYNEPENASEIIYKFENQEKKTKLTLDITNLNFSFQRTDYDASFFQNTTFLEENLAVSSGRGFFSSLGLFDDSLNKTKATYLSFDGEKLVLANKPFEANTVRVDFLRHEVDKAPIITADYDQSNTYLIFAPKISTNLSQDAVIEASFQNFPPETSYPSTYSIVSSNAAWEDLKNGKGFIVRPLFEGTEAVIRKIYLAYFQSFEYQPYLQPVFVFEGDKDFVAIATAVDPFWLGN